jgi:hypothetical protein
MPIVTSLLYVIPKADAKQRVAAPDSIKTKWKFVNITVTTVNIIRLVN